MKKYKLTVVSWSFLSRSRSEAAFLGEKRTKQEIIRCIEALFAFADSIEAKVSAAREKTEKLRQSIIAKAFSGELVETEACKDRG